MKRLLISLLFCLPAVALLMFSSCRKDEVFKSAVINGPAPLASFTYARDPANHLSVTFTSTAANAESVYWKFGDGATSTEGSPTHTYTASGRYMVSFTARSAAGYSSDTTLQIIAAAPAKAGFTLSGSGVRVSFNNTSVSIDSCSWNFGDNTPASDSISPLHLYAAAGNYPVTLTIYGIAGDISVLKDTIAVTYNCINGGGFGAGDALYWTVWGQQNNNPPVFGYTGDPGFGGSGGCLEFPSFTAPGGGSINELIYQPVYVQRGKKYQFSALVKLPAGGKQCYMQFYLSNDPNYWNENNGQQPGTNLLMSLNTWHGWGGFSGEGPTVAVNGNITQIVTQFGNYGPYASLGGLYTANATGVLYLGIQAGSWEGYSAGNYLVDEVSFVQLP